MEGQEYYICQEQNLNYTKDMMKEGEIYIYIYSQVAEPANHIIIFRIEIPNES